MNFAFDKKKYKIQNKDEEGNLNLNLIETVIDNLDNYYDIIDQLSGGGKSNTKRDDKYLSKYKNLIKTSKNSIKYYKNLAEEQIKNQLHTNQYFSNLIYVLKTQRDYLFNEYLSLGKNVKNSKEKIGMLETMINGLEKHVKSSVSLENIVNKIVLKGGGKIYSVFEAEILDNMDELNNHMKNVDDDKKFIENKIKELHSRMKNVVDNSEKLFKIKTKIDWIVKELENKESVEIMETQDYDELLEKVQKAIDNAKTKGNITEDIAQYIHTLEEYASYLENFIKSNDTVLNTIDSKKKATQTSTKLLSDELQTKMLGGRILQKQTGSGALKDKYEQIFKNDIIRITEELQNSKFTNLDIDSILNYVANARQLIYDKENTVPTPALTNPLLSTPVLAGPTPEIISTEKHFYGQVVTILELLKQLDYVVGEYKQVYEYLGVNVKLLHHDETDKDKNVIEKWKGIFSKKNTDYYNEQILKLKIFYFGDNDSTMESALKKIETLDKLALGLDDSKNYDDIIKDTNNVIKKIDDTLVAFDHLTFFLSGMYLSILNYQLLAEDASLIKFNDYFKNKSSVLLRSGIMTNYENFNKYYSKNTKPTAATDKFMSGGGDVKMPDMSKVSIIQIIDKDIVVFMIFFTSYVAHLLEPSEKPSLTNVNLEYLEKLNALTNMFDKLFAKINLKLGGPTIYSKKISEAKQEDSYKKFVSTLELTAASLPATDVAVVHSGSSRPRLDTFVRDLTRCRDKLRPYLENITKLKYLNSKNQKGEFDVNETKSLLTVYNDINSAVTTGINSYIQVLPMIFFTVEYPPMIYKDSTCKFKLTYNVGKEMVTYQQASGETFKECESLGFEKVNEKPVNFQSHAAFFDSNNANGTKKIIDDPVIGLDKLIKVEEDETKPVNNVINIMFALGASGTGKTTRYFGKDNAPNPDDEVGIVPFVINDAIKNSSKKGNDKATISLAYFVCYGRANDSSFDELVIFFDINKITTTDSDANTKYIPFCMPNKQIKVENVESYTDFYSLLVSKQLLRKPFSDIQNYVSSGEEFPKVNEIEKYHYNDPKYKTFREILEGGGMPTGCNIWKDIEKNGDQTKVLSELFETLINEQKKINTVLPTKNNIESSRGHTCVLIRIGSVADGYKYFPLFDMAGTENPSQVKEFFTKERNLLRMERLVKKINKVSQTQKIVESITKETIEYQSLGELLKNTTINNYVQKSMAGGGKRKLSIAELDGQLNKNTAGANETPQKINNFLQKISNEGKYINHTIGMTIFAAMCVGKSLNTIKKDDHDEFDNFGQELFQEITEKYICVKNAPDCTKTKVLLDEISFTSILNSSCIWLQIIFSFLYWNRETQESTYDLIDNLRTFDPKRQQEYITDVQNFDFINGIKINELTQFKKINMEKLNVVATLIKEVNQTCGTLLDEHITKIIYSESENKLNVEYTEKSDADMVELEEPYAAGKQRRTRNKNAAWQKQYKDFVGKLSLHEHGRKIEMIEQEIMDPKSESPNYLNNIKSLLATEFKGKSTDTVEKKKSENYSNKKLLEIYEEILKNLLLTRCDTGRMKELINNINKKLNEDGNLVKLMNNYSYLALETNGSFALYEENSRLDTINNIKTVANNIPELPQPPSLTEQNLWPVLNQMHRIQDGRIAATKMVLMHLVTGQGIKHFMVEETITLAKTLYDSTDLKLNDKSSASGAVGGDMSDSSQVLTRHNNTQLTQMPRLPRLPLLQNPSISNSPNNY